MPETPQYYNIRVFVIIIIISLSIAFLIDYTGHKLPSGPTADWWVITTAHAAGTNGLTCLSKQGVARDNNFGHPSNDRQTLLNFRDRTPKRSDRRAIELQLICNIYKSIISKKYIVSLQELK
jgi:hypothetical protein